MSTEQQTVGLLRESASHEAGHVFMCLSSQVADLTFARASSTGRGTSRLTNAAQLSPMWAARIAVAGRVSEEVLLNLPPRRVPDNDGFLLHPALASLAGEATEDTVRDDVRRRLAGSQHVVRAIAERLATTPDSDVDISALREVYVRTDSTGPSGKAVS
jgi:hypothetical protein